MERNAQQTRSACTPRTAFGHMYVLGPVPEVDVMAKRPQGLLNVGDSFRADGGAARAVFGWGGQRHKATNRQAEQASPQSNR
jgi:hypothetical protein